MKTPYPGLAFFTCLLTLAPLPASAQSPSSVKLCKEDRTAKGLAACDAILKLKSKPEVKAATYNNRALTLMALGRNAEAVASYDEVVKLAPFFGPIHADRGRAKFAAGDRDGAAADIARAIELDSTNPENYANLAYIKVLREDYTGARADLEKGLFWRKDHARSAYILGLVDYRTGQYATAVANVDRARRGGFTLIDTYVTRSLANFRRGAFEAAEKDASDGLTEKPEQPDLLEARARIRLALKRPAEAMADANEAVRLAPKNALTYSTRASAHLALNEIDAARADADKAIEVDPKLFDAYLAKAEAALDAADKPAARTLFQQVVAMPASKNAQDEESRQRAAGRLAEMDKPKPVVVSELGDAELQERCGKKDDPLRMAACDRLVEAAADPQAKARTLILRSQARPYQDRMGDLDLAVAAAPDDPDALLARSRGRLASYRFDADIEPLKLAFADADAAVRHVAPDSKALPGALFARAQAASSLGRYDDAIVDLTRLLELGPKANAGVHAVRALDYLMAGKPELALADARETHKAALESRMFYFEQDIFVLSLLETGRIDEAAAELAAWKAQNTGADRVRNLLEARLLLAKGDNGAAFQAAEVALFSSALSKQALAIHGIASARLGRFDAAIADLTQVIDKAAELPMLASYEKLTPGFVSEIFLSRGRARAAVGLRSGAWQDFSEVIRRSPERAIGYAERARAAYANGDAAAVPDIVMALRIEPDEPRWQALAARITLASGDAATAVKTATAAIDKKAADPDLLAIRARARLQLADFAGAAEDAKTRIAAVPSDVEAQLVLIEAQAGAGDLKGAAESAQLARNAVSDDRIAMALADVKAKTGDVPGAIGIYEDMARAPANLLAANKRLGDLYAGIGSDQLALGYYAKAIDAPLRGPADTKLRDDVKTARDALIRKMAAPK